MATDNVVQHLERAWVLVAADPNQVNDTAEGIFELNDALEDPSAVVRADVVSGTYNIVVPVYAEEESLIDDIVSMIENVDGVKKTEKLVITDYYPFPPHDAPGYITGEEAETTNPIAPGPMGMNGWG
jgi:hypothetical protein